MTHSSSYLASFVESLNKKNEKVKLHLGCGGIRWKDYINIDLYPQSESPDSSRSGCVADFFADIRKLDLPNESVDYIFSSHVLEHFTRWEALEMLQNWYNLLKNGGELVVEMPDFWRCVMWLFHPKKRKRILAQNQFYGNQWDKLDYETHRYVWKSNEFKNELLSIGFRKVMISHKTETHRPGRDMRVVAKK